MTHPHRSFEVPDVSGVEGPTFDLGAVTLRCLPSRPAGVIEDLPNMANLDDLVAFIRGCLVDADVAAFNAAIHDKARIVDNTLIIAVYEWVVEAYAGFIPGLPSPSANGQPAMTRSSAADSASPDGTPPPSTSPPGSR